jgi:hypothetical protein
LKHKKWLRLREELIRRLLVVMMILVKRIGEYLFKAKSKWERFVIKM